jgi:uncharacterized repeat protein (TIGR03803 family)
MRSKMMFSALKLAGLVLGCSLAVVGTAGATQEKVLHRFAGTPAADPSSGLVADPLGNLYGVTDGAVYEVSPMTGGWKYQSIATLLSKYDLAGGTLARDGAGNLYGATWQGGTNGCGYVYELSPGSGGTWSFAVLHTFDCTNGAHASYTMVFDAHGNLYGGANDGGTYLEGVVFELSPGSGGSWTYSVLHNFSNAEGNGPQTGLTFDTKGNLYGGNETGIFELSPNGDGTWTESSAYTFSGDDGVNPTGDLCWDAAGNLYGTNEAGGKYSSGTAFMLSPNPGGGWTSTVLHSFNYKNNNDGYYPDGGLTVDLAGSVYGTAQFGGGTGNSGIVFKLTPGGTGTWTESLLHRFGATGNKNGTFPLSSLYRDGAGNLYGVTAEGGDSACYSPNGCGVVYELVP